jgi:release factor glutamine methyltransferase
MPTLSEKLDEAETILRENGVVDARREASSILSLALKRNKTFLVAHPEYLLAPAEETIFDGFVQRRASHEPFQYISGIQEFYGFEFEVTADVLIPRPETEIVVERSIEILREAAEQSFCEVGVGSGCISVCILAHLPSAKAVGLDISQDALKIARHNAEKHGVADRLVLRESNTFASISGERFELIVSNPPYVPDGDIGGLQSEVRSFEPHLALAGGADGLSIIRQIVDASPDFLRPKGYLLLEIGFDQSERVTRLFDRSLWQEPELLPDLQGIPRVLIARIN